ncbi:MAG: gamma-glutamyl-gamma-aminobutyrate hydrolase family protein [Halanaerobiaceae bacterium]
MNNKKLKKLIGITSNHTESYREYILNACYAEAIIAAGGLPVILPVSSNKIVIEEYVNKIDGLLLTGGSDIDPLIYGENPLPGIRGIDPLRDGFEIDLVRYARKKKLPILGVCKGCQVLNISFGGTLYQDIASQLDNVLKHNQEAPRWYATHRVNIRKDTVLHEIIGKTTIKVNSIHHQSIKNISPSFNISAEADDNIIEAIEYKTDDFIMGIQWHPETMWKNSDDNYRIFQYFINQC